MVITFRNSMISLLTLAAGCLTVWSLLLSKNGEQINIKENPDLPDAYMENVIATFMNKDGAPCLKITTPKMIHYTLNDVTTIDKPNIDIYRQTPNPWNVSSDFAKTFGGTEQILFWSNVVIKHELDKNNPTTTMKTSALMVYPDKRTAHTDQPVTIIQPDITVHAVGMQADMNDGTIKLLSQTQGEYVPPTT